MSTKIDFESLWLRSLDYRIQQIMEEWLFFLSFLEEPKTSLEIGAKYGGTAFGLIKVSQEGGHVISIDPLPPRVKDLENERPSIKYSFLQGGSQESYIIQKAVEYAPFDVLFIDGEHHDDSPTQDFKNFLPHMNRKTGIIGFHDIKGKKSVVEIWSKIKSISPGATKELVTTPGKNGIGIFFLGKAREEIYLKSYSI